jgi:hypothetical protein
MVEFYLSKAYAKTDTTSRHKLVQLRACDVTGTGGRRARRAGTKWTPARRVGSPHV